MAIPIDLEDFLTESRATLFIFFFSAKAPVDAG